MKSIFLIFLVVSITFTPILADAHQSGCHRWHSCPSDSGSYVCGDLGYYSQCPSYYHPKADPKPEPPNYTETPIPSWIKNSAGWWAKGQIDDTTFVSGIQFLIKENILKIPQTTQGTNLGSNHIPTWIKNNAGWWSDGQIGDSDFVSGIQFLIKEGIMDISNSTKENCDSSYPDVCIPPFPPDLDCGEIEFSNFRVIQPDSHGFDTDFDGIGCEK